MTVDTYPDQQPTLTMRSLAALAAIGLAALVALLVVRGRWFEALALLAAFPALILVQRHPLITVAGWFAVYPLLVGAEDGGSAKLAVWAVHRLAPLATLIIVWVATRSRSSHRTLPKLGVAEALMVGYVVVSLLSIVYQSDAVIDTIRQFYDRTIVPVILYLLIRLLKPSFADFRKLAPALVLLLVSQAVIGALQWFAPGVLPDWWLGRAGTRTTGSFGHPNVYGVAVLFAGLMLLHLGRSEQTGRLRAIAFPAFGTAVLLAFLTFSRASWLAACIIVLGLLFVYRSEAKKMIAVGSVALILLGLSAALGPTAEYFEERLYSEESALSRLPVVVASIRMFQERPLTGFGYGNFNDYDREYQSSIEGIYVPDKDHSSHNLYLTIAAEQGIFGLVTYLGPALYWLVLTPAARRRLPPRSARLLMVLWLSLASHVIVNNFSNMKVSFGLGLWWATLAMIGVLVADTRTQSLPAARESRTI
jgi:O-antigen ligase